MSARADAGTVQRNGQLRGLGGVPGLDDDKIGSLEVGKLADLIVLDQNLFEIDPHEIHNTNVELTMMDGIVRQRDGL